MSRKRLRKNKPVQYWIEYSAVMFALIWIRLATRPAIYRFAENLGRFAFDIIKIRRKVVLANLRKAFPEKTESERIRIGRRAYQIFGKNIMNAVRAPLVSKSDFLSDLTITGRCHVDAALKKRKGVILVGGHFGDFELGAMTLPILGYPSNTLVGNQHNKKIDEIINAARSHCGANIIRMGVGSRNIIKALRRNEIALLLSDQDARDEGVFVNFFGRPSSTPQGAALFALKTGAAMVFIIARQLPRGRFHVKYRPVNPGKLEGSKEDNIRQLTQAFTSILEEEIRETPDQYFWLHKRWKTTPK